MRDPSTYRPATHLEQPPDGYTSEDTATAIDPATSEESPTAIVDGSADGWEDDLRSPATADLARPVPGEAGWSAKAKEWLRSLSAAHLMIRQDFLLKQILEKVDLDPDEELLVRWALATAERELKTNPGTAPEETPRRQLQAQIPTSDEPPTAIGVDVGAPEGDKTVIVGPLPTSLAYGSRR